MRVIAGKYKGLLLTLPKGTEIRPTAQKVKEALFNILGGAIEGGSFLELFAGSGAVGIEALSRGAGAVVFAEKDRDCLKAIDKNLRQLGVPFNYGLGKEHLPVLILPFEAERAVELLHREKARFDLVFLDPPYYQDELKNCLLKICRYDILKPSALVIAEHRKTEILPEQFPLLTLMVAKRYGDTVLSFYKKAEKV